MSSRSGFMRWLSRRFSSVPVRPSRSSAFRPRVEGMEDRLAPAVFDVTTAANGGAGSLRQAIIDANATPGADTITFSISGKTVISLTKALPGITETVTIDGSTQEGFDPANPTPLVVINGANAKGGHGLSIGAGANGCVIKSLVINKFDGSGIALISNNNVVQGNFIGTDATGTADAGNGTNGITIFSGSSGNLIGGTSDFLGNLISGNGKNGVQIDAASNNTVVGNTIGTDWTSGFALPNASNGVLISNGSANNTVGDAAGVNLIQGNALHAIVISGAGTSGNTVTNNVLSNNSKNGVVISKGATNNAITDLNTISANGANGIVITNKGTTGNTVTGNMIGTDLTGTSATVGNKLAGISISKAASGNTIGGTAAADRNVISGNRGDGIAISNGSSNTVIGNYIGVDSAGTGALPNKGHGVKVVGKASLNTIGGTAVGAGNVISGNAKNGVVIAGPGTTGNTLAGNTIGLDATGTAAMPNAGGVHVANGASANTIGGTAAGAGNTISGNTTVGVRIVGANLNLVQGNKIGTQSDGTGLFGNGSHGVFVTGKAAKNTIGGAGAGNTIANNGGAGVLIGFDKSTTFTTNAGNGNMVSANSIFTNGLLGIDLNAKNAIPTPNDNRDPDLGANLTQNYPVLTTAVVAGGQITINFTLNSNPNQTFRVELFASTVGDPSGNGEGQNFLGFVTVTTDATGVATGVATLPYSAGLGPIITATATNTTTGNSSEFSAFITAV